MGRRRASEDEESRRHPARSLTEREQQLTSMAYDLAERQIRDGSASSQTIAHFLKMGSSRELLEQERLIHEKELTQAKIEGMSRGSAMEELATAAIKAMRTYTGQDQGEEDSEDPDAEWD